MKKKRLTLVGQLPAIIKSAFSTENSGAGGSKAEKTNNIIDYAKKALITKVDLDITTTSMVRKFLNEKCRRFGFGNSTILSIYGDMFIEGNLDYAFYKLYNDGDFFIYKNCLIYMEFIRNEHTGVSISFIRGTLNLKKFIKEVREFNRSVISNNDTEEYVNFNNYRIIECSGFVGRRNIARLNDDSESPVTDRGQPISQRGEIYSTDEFLNCTYSDINIKSKKKSPFETLYYPKEIMDTLTGINTWLKRKQWLLERGLPWKRGILLHGPGGTGKSSFVKAVGRLFGLPIYHFYLSTMNDEDFKKNWANAVSNTPCIILLEDFDNVFKKRVPVNKDANINFDTVLNTISGIQDATGILLFITTNHIENIDEAIGIETSSTTGISTRPGRIDKVVYMGTMTEETKLKLVCKILKDWPSLIGIAMNETSGYTAAQVQEYCIQRALEQLKDED